MVRIRVVRASRLLLIGAAILLFVTVLAMVVQLARTAAPQIEPAGEAAAYAAALSVSVVFPAVEDEHTDRALDGFQAEILPRTTAAPRALHRAPTVLIYHTHTHEAYRQEENDPYIELEQWRTDDKTHSIVRVGQALADALIRRGFSVTHDTTDHEPPKLGTAYQRSLKTLESYGQPFDLYIDLHRDAYAAELMPLDALSTPDGAMARLMVLIGNGDGFDEKPDVQVNLGYANRLTERLNALYPGLCRDVCVKVGRYNQHIASPAILVEVGHHLNTLTEALASMPALAQAIMETL